MAITVKMHSTDFTAQTCVVTVKDDGVIVVDKKNVGFGPWPNSPHEHPCHEQVKEVVAEYRRNRTPIIVDTGEV